MSRKILLVVNTGTPDSPDVRSVRKYLSEFLNDRRVIEIPWLLRKILVNIIIVPFRSFRSARKYRKLWTEKGSPLLIHLNELVSRLQSRLKDDYIVIGAMRYGKPSLKDSIGYIKELSPDRLVVFPLYPHYASSTTGSVNEYIMKELKNSEIIPEIKFTGQFYSHPGYLSAVTARINVYNISDYDHILFTYHGLPLSQIRKLHHGKEIEDCDCENHLPAEGRLCYKATCYETTRLLAGASDLGPGTFSTSFQSRLSRNWLSPFTDKKLVELAAEGKKRILLVAPSFTADCLETTFELGEEYRTLFFKAGGEKLDLVESLNDDENWVDSIIEIAEL